MKNFFKLWDYSISAKYTFSQWLQVYILVVIVLVIIWLSGYDVELVKYGATIWDAHFNYGAILPVICAGALSLIIFSGMSALYIYRTAIKLAKVWHVSVDSIVIAICFYNFWRDIPEHDRVTMRREDFYTWCRVHAFSLYEVLDTEQ